MHFTIAAQILARSLANFTVNKRDRHMNVYFMLCGNEREKERKEIFGSITT